MYVFDYFHKIADNLKVGIVGGLKPISANIICYLLSFEMFPSFDIWLCVIFMFIGHILIIIGREKTENDDLIIN